MIRQFVIFAAFTVAFGLQVDECSYGESYWCSSLKIAKQCKAYKHCMTTVWTQERLPKDNTDTCTFCENIMKDVKTFIDNKQTQAQIAQFLNSACSVLPAAEVQMCKDAVKNYLPEILTMIDQAMDPQVICATIGLCKGLEDKVKHQPLNKKPVKMAGNICTDCKTFFTDIKNELTDKTTEKELEDLIDQQLCAQLGQLENTCKTMVSAYVPQIMTALQQEVDPNMICSMLAFCNSTATPQEALRMIMMKKLTVQKMRQSRPVKSSVGASAQCVLCEFVMKEVDGLLQQNSTQAEIMAALDKVCSLLPATIKDECTSFVNTYGPAVIALLEQELTPDQVCTALGLCKSAVRIPMRLQASEPCIVCETMIQYLDSILTKQPTEKEIEQALDKVCNFLPSSVASQCESIVNQYAPLIIQIIAQEATPAQVCSFIGLCKNSTKAHQTMTKMEKILPAKANLVGVDECTYGPAFWCETRANAKKCKAEAHCKKHVWKE